MASTESQLDAVFAAMVPGDKKWVRNDAERANATLQ
jgi:hypothetical protein